MDEGAWPTWPTSTAGSETRAHLVASEDKRLTIMFCAKSIDGLPTNFEPETMAAPPWPTPEKVPEPTK